MSEKKSEAVVKDIKRKPRRKFSAEEKISIVPEGFLGGESISVSCRSESIAPNLYYHRGKDLPKAEIDQAQAPTTGKVKPWTHKGGLR